MTTTRSRAIETPPSDTSASVADARKAQTLDAGLPIHYSGSPSTPSHFKHWQRRLRFAGIVSSSPEQDIDTAAVIKCLSGEAFDVIFDQDCENPFRNVAEIFAALQSEFVAIESPIQLYQQISSLKFQWGQCPKEFGKRAADLWTRFLSPSATDRELCIKMSIIMAVPISLRERLSTCPRDMSLHDFSDVFAEHYDWACKEYRSAKQGPRGTPSADNSKSYHGRQRQRNNAQPAKAVTNTQPKNSQ